MLLRIRRIRELQFVVPEFVDRTGGSNRVRAQPANPSVACGDSSPFSGACGTPMPPLKRGGQLVKKGFDKLVDGEASSPATTTLTSFC